MTDSHASAVGLEIVDEQRSAGCLEQRLRVPVDLPCLEGHFPGFPLLPGLAQLAWAVEAASMLCSLPVAVVRVEALKFRELLAPGEEFLARALMPDDCERLDFQLLREERVVASGRLRLACGKRPLALVPSLERQPAQSAPSLLASEALPARQLIPHDDPMVFLDRLLTSDRKKTICSLQIDDLRLFRAESGALPVWAGIEPMAQCIAARGGLEARRRGEAPKVGFLLGCRRLELGAEWLEPGVGYAVSAAQVWGGEKGLVAFDCEIFERDGGRRVLAGRINAYLPDELPDGVPEEASDQPSELLEGRSMPKGRGRGGR